MDKNGQVKSSLMPFMAVSLAPVGIFALGNALFLPLVGAMTDFSNSFFIDLLPSFDPFGSRLILIAVSMLCLPISAASALIGPPLTAFLVNLVHPVLTDRRIAVWSGIVFFFINMIFLVALRIYLFISQNYSIYDPGTYMRLVFDPLACLLFLAGIALSCAVAFAGRLGAQKGSLKRKRAGSA